MRDFMRLYPEKRYESELEYSYRLKTACEGTDGRFGEYSIVNATDILNNILAYDNSCMHTERLDNSWAGTEAFLSNSVAFVALKSTDIVGIIIGSSRYNDVIPVDIEVAHDHRRQGLGTALARHMLSECAPKGITLQWDHTESNKASMALAAKLGFVPFRTRRYYWFEF